MISQKLNPHRSVKDLKSLKAEKTLHRVTFSPSSAKQGETLMVKLPILSEDTVLVPNTLALRFDLTIQPDTADARIIVNNVGRNIISRIRITMAGETLQDTNRYDLYKTYEDLYRKDRSSLIAQGISSLMVRKLRTPMATLPTDSTGETAVADAKPAATVFAKKYLAPLDFELLTNHGAYHLRGLPDLTFEITLCDANNLIGGLDTKLTDAQTYKMENIELQYESIRSPALATVPTRAFLYDHVQLWETFVLDDKESTKFNKLINLPRRSMTGLLLLFVKPFESGKRDSEAFYNMTISDVRVTINGMPFRIYSAGMKDTDLYEAAKRRFSSEVTPEEFYAKHYCLWIDLRTHEDNDVHGSGLHLQGLQGGISLEITRTAAETAASINAYIFVVSDAQVNVNNGLLEAVMY